MSTVLLSGGEKVMPGQIDFSKGTALGNPDNPLALHTGDGCNVSSGVQPCHAEKVSGPLSVSGKAQEKWFMQSVFRVKSGLHQSMELADTQVLKLLEYFENILLLIG